MRLAHLGHACLQLDTEDGRVVIDPGVFSTALPDRADAVLLTHRHPDHVAPEAVASLAATGATVLAEAGAADVLRASAAMPPDSSLAILSPGQELTVAGLQLAVVGGRHAVIHAEIPRVGNVGLLLRERSGATVFHPGDAYEHAPDGVDVLAVPLAAPWAAVTETVEFVRAVGPSVAVPVHDALVTPAGRDIYLGHVRRLGGARVHDPAVDGPLHT